MSNNGGYPFNDIKGDEGDYYLTCLFELMIDKDRMARVVRAVKVGRKVETLDEETNDYWCELMTDYLYEENTVGGDKYLPEMEEFIQDIENMFPKEFLDVY